MPRTREHTFGLGRHETLTVTTWIGKVDNGNRRVHVRVTGSVTEYPGDLGGVAVEVPVDETYAAWKSENRALTLCHNGDEDALVDIAEIAASDAFDDWLDFATTTDNRKAN